MTDVSALDQIIDRAQSIRTTADTENRDYSEDETVELESLFEQAKKLESGFSAGRRSSPNPIRHYPDFGYQASEPAKPKSIKALFGRVADDWHGFRDGGDYFRALLSGRPDPRLRRVSIQDVAVEETGVYGGFTVPGSLMSEILDPAIDTEIVRPRARVHPMTSASLAVASPDMTDHSAGIAGFSAAWTSENTDPGGQTPLWRSINLVAKKIFIRGEASNELLMDSPTALEDIYIGLRGATAFGLDRAFIAGTGAGQPQGILNAVATKTVAKEGGQAADTLTWPNLRDMFAALHPGGHRRAIWLAHPSTLPALLAIHRPVLNIAETDAVSGSHVLVGSADTGYSMMGRPLILTEHCNVLGDLGDILYVDPMHYHVGLRSDAVIQTSNAPGWDRDVMSFRLILRVDGQAGWPGLLTLRDGSTYGFAAVLAERA